MEQQFPFTANDYLFKHLHERRELFRISPEKIYPWWRWPCRVKTLLLTDGSLDFGPGDFGLSTFVSILKNDGRAYVDFEITIAHRGPFVGDPGVAVARSVPNFRFDNASHFTASMYDQVWLFGFNTGSSLSNAELTALSAFMNGGGGVFATGDHGALGQGLCGAITRVRKMRRWDNASGEVGMTDPRRNDTNRLGHDPGSQFDDQSDDIPQTIQPRLYSSWWGAFWRETYPHPVLCSPLGRITVLPDHPHEGECLQPSNLSDTFIDGSQEFPGGIAPQIIAWSTVPAGNTAGNTKQATQAQRFGAISAYDGHKAKVGRVITDATWHHFVNVNLVGELVDFENNRGTTEDPSKINGFLSSPSGQQHFTQIKHYYINIGVWLSRPSNIYCFNSRFIWELVFNHRILEATTDNPNIPLEKISPALLYTIGSHAVDVLGKRASQCRRLRLVVDIFEVLHPEIARLIDPWVPEREIEPNPPIPWFDYNPLMALTIGAGLVAVREHFVNDKRKDVNKIQAEEIFDLFTKGASRGLELGLNELDKDLQQLNNLKQGFKQADKTKKK